MSPSDDDLRRSQEAYYKARTEALTRLNRADKVATPFVLGCFGLVAVFFLIVVILAVIGFFQDRAGDEESQPAPAPTVATAPATAGPGGFTEEQRQRLEKQRENLSEDQQELWDDALNP